MSTAVNKLIEVAEAETGYLEKASNASLDSNTDNAGSANFTKYARDLDAIPNFYNGKKNGYAWCDMFVDWCFVTAFGVEQAKKLLLQPDNSGGAGCKYSANYYRKKGQFHTTPKVGDQIFFGLKEGQEEHTGIVYKVTASKVHTIEGNTSGASGVVANGGGVCKKSYSLTYKRIIGYGRPAYDVPYIEAEEPAQEPVVAPTPVTKKEVCEVELKMLKKGSEGEAVKALQILLIGYGFSCGSYGADGDFGSATDKAVRSFQKAKGLVVDGVVGPKTWEKLLGV